MSSATPWLTRDSRGKLSRCTNGWIKGITSCNKRLTHNGHYIPRYGKHPLHHHGDMLLHWLLSL